MIFTQLNKTFYRYVKYNYNVLHIMLHCISVNRHVYIQNIGKAQYKIELFALQHIKNHLHSILLCRNTNRNIKLWCNIQLIYKAQLKYCKKWLDRVLKEIIIKC